MDTYAGDYTPHELFQTKYNTLDKTNIYITHLFLLLYISYYNDCEAPFPFPFSKSLGTVILSLTSFTIYKPVWKRSHLRSFFSRTQTVNLLSQ